MRVFIMKKKRGREADNKHVPMWALLKRKHPPSLTKWPILCYCAWLFGSHVGENGINKVRKLSYLIPTTTSCSAHMARNIDTRP